MSSLYFGASFDDLPPSPEAIGALRIRVDHRPRHSAGDAHSRYPPDDAFDISRRENSSMWECSEFASDGTVRRSDEKNRARERHQ